jgi:hypothetical protein
MTAGPTPGWHLAQINVARFTRDRDDPANADFDAALDLVNARADASPGFVWRLIGDGGNATDIEAVPGDPQLLINLSVWTDLESLMAFAYRQADHVAVLRRRAEWFEKMPVSHALWWVPAGTWPSVPNAMGRLDRLALDGPTPEAFTFTQHFPPPTG